MGRLNEFLNRAGGWITGRVGTMWAAIVFALLAAVSLPAALHSGDPIIIVGWLAQTFLQLVLLPVIMVGQNQAAAGTEQLIRETHDTVVEHFGHVHNALGTPLAADPLPDSPDPAVPGPDAAPASAGPGTAPTTPQEHPDGR